jgi:hypothetical protein
MLDLYFKYRGVLRRLRGGALGEEMDRIAAHFSEIGYKPASAKLYISRLARFSDFVNRNSRTAKIDQTIIDRFVQSLPTASPRIAARTAIEHARRVPRRRRATCPRRRCRRPQAAPRNSLGPPRSPPHAGADRPSGRPLLRGPTWTWPGPHFAGKTCRFTAWRGCSAITLSASLGSTRSPPASFSRGACGMRQTSSTMSSCRIAATFCFRWAVSKHSRTMPPNGPTSSAEAASQIVLISS